ncbi:hypothetical protein FHS55_004089 [Angulomicrobium tetraedrale]|uniref:Uncharacterized protein n=1 Tax=Ancylobacter tetraedralis TaxID=217068 RepID=A0A839ZFW1_9HYPH|nr:hypothetical protein [Ancylobacter tetraedralis]
MQTEPLPAVRQADGAPANLHEQDIEHAAPSPVKALGHAAAGRVGARAARRGEEQ